MAIFDFIIQLVDINCRISIINDVSLNLAEVSNIHSNGKELCLKFHNVMKNLVITNKKTIANILCFPSDDIIEKIERMLIDFNEEEIFLYDKRGERVSLIVLGSYHLEQIEKLLNK